MFEIKKRKWLFYLAVGVFGILFLFLLLYLFREPVGIFLSHVNNKSELAFVKEFLSELKRNEKKDLGKYFLPQAYQRIPSRESAQMLFMDLERDYGKGLRKRKFIIERIGFDKERKNCFVNLSVMFNHARVPCITLVLIQKNGRYFIEHFLFRGEFPFEFSLNAPSGQPLGSGFSDPYFHRV